MVSVGLALHMQLMLNLDLQDQYWTHWSPIQKDASSWCLTHWNLKLNSQCDSQRSATVPGKAKLVIVKVGGGTFSCWVAESMTRKHQVYQKWG
jgi:hypothetical protein